MSEFFFVLKCMAITAVLTMALQLQMGRVTLESKLQVFLETSPAIAWVQSAASGGALMIQRTASLVSTKVQDLMSDKKSATGPERAGR